MVTSPGKNSLSSTAIIAVLTVLNIVQYTGSLEKEDIPLARFPNGSPFGNGAYRVAFDGKAIWQAIPVVDSLTRQLLGGSRSAYSIVLVLGRIQCSACYEFHRDRIRSLADTYSVPLFAVARGGYRTLLAKDFPRMTFLPYRDSLANLISGEYSHAVFLVDRCGKILCSDVSEQAGRDIGETFYSVLSNFLSKQ